MVVVVGNLLSRRGKIGIVEEGPQPDSVAMLAEKKKLKQLKKKSLTEAKN